MKEREEQIGHRVDALAYVIAVAVWVGLALTLLVLLCVRGLPR